MIVGLRRSTYVLSARIREDLHGEGRHKVGRELDEMNLASWFRTLDREEIASHDNHHQVSYITLAGKG